MYNTSQFSFKSLRTQVLNGYNLIWHTLHIDRNRLNIRIRKVGSFLLAILTKIFLFSLSLPSLVQVLAIPLGLPIQRADLVHKDSELDRKKA
jgi:hypothetical protein